MVSKEVAFDLFVLATMLVYLVCIVLIILAL